MKLSYLPISNTHLSVILKNYISKSSTSRPRPIGALNYAGHWNVKRCPSKRASSLCPCCLQQSERTSSASASLFSPFVCLHFFKHLARFQAAYGTASQSWCSRTGKFFQMNPFPGPQCLRKRIVCSKQTSFQTIFRCPRWLIAVVLRTCRKISQFLFPASGCAFCSKQTTFLMNFGNLCWMNQWSLKYGP